jgi:hypothetical protein
LKKENKPEMAIGGGAASKSIAEVKQETAPADGACRSCAGVNFFFYGTGREGWTQRVSQAGMAEVGEKKPLFGRNAIQIAICRYFIVIPPYPLPKIYDG